MKGSRLLAAAALVGSGLVAMGGAPAAAGPVPNPDIFSGPGAYDYYVPGGVTSIAVTAIGAAGGGVAVGPVCIAASGGEGAEVTATVAVTPGQHLLVGVGSPGAQGNCSGSTATGGAGGSNGGTAPSGKTVPGGGGAGGDSAWDHLPGAGGGGASVVMAVGAASTTPVVVAGGGGGAGGDGGVSGATAVDGGNAGAAGMDTSSGASGGGAGGTGGGAGGASGTNFCVAPPALTSSPGAAGSSLTGGAGGPGATTSVDISGGGGGGGAGYFGGGGGGGNPCDGDGGGGGGGSSYVSGTGVVAGTATTHAAEVIISYGAAPPPAPAPPAAAIAVPASGATLAQGQVVDSSFTCTEGAGGPGLASCLDGAGAVSGQPLDTSTPGAHTLTVTATSLDGLTGTATVTYDVAGPPGAVIEVPGPGALYHLGQAFDSSFSCTPGAYGPGLASCLSSTTASATPSAGVGQQAVGATHPAATGSPTGTPVDTSTPGPHTFTVTATSLDGLTGTASVTYDVAAPPAVSISVPTDGETFPAGQSAATAFACTEGIGGPGLASCLDGTGRPSGAPLDTSTPGSHTLTVTAISLDGLTATASVTYSVVAAGSASSPSAGPAAEVPAAGQQLPFTGARLGPEGMAATGLLVLGGFVLVGSRRPSRRRPRPAHLRRRG